MASIGMALGIFAAVFHLTGYGLYGHHNYFGRQQLNAATWALWVILSWLSGTSYLAMSGDPARCIATFAGGAACTVVLILALTRKSVSRVDGWDCFLFAVGIAAAGVWWHWRSATAANLILQGAIGISMIPTYRRLFVDAAAERPMPWLLWTAGYTCVLGTVILRWHGHWADLVLPISNGIACGGVALIGFFGKNRTPS